MTTQVIMNTKDAMVDLACAAALHHFLMLFTHRAGVDGVCSCGKADCVRSAGKHPIMKSWEKTCTSDEQTLRQQATQFRFVPNVSVALGERSDGSYLVCIDGDDAGRFAELVAEHGELPKTSESKSPRGSHLFFLLPEGTPRDRVKNVTGIGGKKGVDMKAQGGQVVVYGRNAGGEYSDFDPSASIAELPPAWVLAIMAPTRLPRDVHKFTPSTLREDAKTKNRYRKYLDASLASECMVLSRVGEGQRNANVYRVAFSMFSLANGLMLPGVWGHVRDEVTRAGIATGLSQREVQQTVASAEKVVSETGRTRMPREVPRDDAARGARPAHARDDDTIGAPIAHSDAPIAAADSSDDFDDEEAPSMRSPRVDALSNIVLAQDNGAPAKTAGNVALMLADYPKGMPRLNVFSDLIVWVDGSPLIETDALDVHHWLMTRPITHRIRVGKDIAFDGIVMAARRNPFHAVRDYLDGLKWDGVPRLDELFVAYFGVEDSPYTRAVASCFALGAVARIYQPGCKVDTIPICEGKQGLKKSTAIKALVGEQWFSDTTIDLSSKDRFENLGGVWIYELAEMETLSRADRGRMKAYTSSPTDRYRPSYGRLTVVRPRSTVFVGTTNEGEYLDDDTGGRRSHPLRCSAIDVDAIRQDRDQLWAEAVARFKDGEQWWLPAGLEPAAADVVEGRRQVDPWEDTLQTYLASRDSSLPPFTTRAVLCALGVETAKQDRAQAHRVCRVLRRLGWEKVRRRVDADLIWAWVRILASA